MSTFRKANGMTVFVREYLRLRLGKWETVKSHLRKWALPLQDHFQLVPAWAGGFGRPPFSERNHRSAWWRV
jgi:hypothetical protein